MIEETVKILLIMWWGIVAWEFGKWLGKKIYERTNRE